MAEEAVLPRTLRQRPGEESVLRVAQREQLLLLGNDDVVQRRDPTEDEEEAKDKELQAGRIDVAAIIAKPPAAVAGCRARQLCRSLCCRRMRSLEHVLRPLAPRGLDIRLGHPDIGYGKDNPLPGARRIAPAIRASCQRPWSLSSLIPPSRFEHRNYRVPAVRGVPVATGRRSRA